MIEFEKALLGACLRSEDNIPSVIDGLKEENLSSTKHRAIFRGIKSLAEKKAPVDTLTLQNQLKSQGIEILSSEILELEELYFDGLDLNYYIDQVKISSKKRELESMLSDSLQGLRNSSVEYPEFEGKIIKGIMAILDERKDRGLRSGENILKGVIETYYQRKIEREQGRKYFGVPTGFKALDNILGGLQDGALGILAGRQHHGKSTVAMDMFLYALKKGISSLYISLEQPSSEILLHLIQKETGIKPLNIKSGNLTENEERTLTGEIYSEFKKLPVFFEDRTRTLGEISMKIRRMVLSHQVKFVVADYLQLIENPIKGEPRHIEVAGISRALKRLAMDLNIPILALSQLNKNPEERESKKIYLSDMRESEAISQDADYVIFIHRPVLMGKDDKDHLELAKNRHGEAIPRVNVIWDRRRNTYRELGGTNERQGSL
jgi:replicative DNA helicase